MCSKTVLKKPIILVLIFLTIFTRFIKLDWGDGFFFHPDENNMGISVTQLHPNNFNPNFFAYGQFPLYLSYLSAQIFNMFQQPQIKLDQAIFFLRFWSAVFSSLSVLFFYLISKKLFKKDNLSIIFSFFIIFTPGLIQLAHFGTTESFLILVFAVNIYLSFLILKQPQLKYVIFAGIVSGLGLGTKITAGFFIIPIILSLLFAYWKSKNKSVFSFIVYFPIITLLFFVITSPYSIIDNQNWLSALNYETSVATGKLRVFYTNQFLDSKPYIFQFLKIFPYTNGLPLYFLGIIGFITFILTFKSKKTLLKRQYWLLIIIPSLVYFIYNGQLYTKWTRFMSPLFFVFPIFTIYFLNYIKNKKLRVIISIFSIIPGLIFLNQYLKPDIRISASSWITQNIPSNSKIISEAGNVINFPITSRNNYQINNFDFYHLDEQKNLKDELINEIDRSQYIIVPSRRIFKNQFIPSFPVSSAYYGNLFSGQLGFTQIQNFNPPKELFLIPENAEETWTVFDHPTVRIYKKIKQLNLNEYKNLLNP